MHRSLRIPSFITIIFFSFNYVIANEALWNLFNEMDTNKDGYVTKSESSGIVLRNFDRADKNADNRISKQEVTEIIERIQKWAGKIANPPPPVSQQPRLPSGVAWQGNLAYRDGNPRWTLDISYPTAKGKLYPGIIFVHGGGWVAGSKSDWHFRTMPVEYAAKGYVCISVNYRLLGEQSFPACLEDVKCAVRWLRANADTYQLDPTKIGAFGESAGGHLVSMLGVVGNDAKLEGDGPYLDYSSAVQAVCAVAPPTDFNSMYVFGFLPPGPAESRKDRVKQASPISYAHQDAPPFLVIHGSQDRIVDYSQGQSFVDALTKAGAPAKLLTVDAGHGVFHTHRRQTRPAVQKFFAKHLQESDQ